MPRHGRAFYEHSTWQFLDSENFMIGPRQAAGGPPPKIALLVVSNLELYQIDAGINTKCHLRQCNVQYRSGT